MLLVGVGAAACSTDPASPRNDTSPTPKPLLGVSAPSVTREHGVRVFRGRSGRTFRVDHDARVVRDDRGHVMALDASQLQMVERSLDDLAAAREKLAYLERDPGFKVKMKRNLSTI